jgi:hypothetical protein
LNGPPVAPSARNHCRPGAAIDDSAWLPRPCQVITRSAPTATSASISTPNSPPSMPSSAATTVRRVRGPMISGRRRVVPSDSSADTSTCASTGSGLARASCQSKKRLAAPSARRRE